jgi:hypothetical protein
MRLVGKSEINVVIGNTLTEGFVVVIAVQGIGTSSGESVLLQMSKIPDGRISNWVKRSSGAPLRN